MDRLQCLIFSFYREEPALQKMLRPLMQSRMTRSWGSIRIECSDMDHLKEITNLLHFIRPPLAALSLGRQIVLKIPGKKQIMFPMTLSSHSDLPAL